MASSTTDQLDHAWFMLLNMSQWLDVHVGVAPGSPEYDMQADMRKLADWIAGKTGEPEFSESYRSIRAFADLMSE